MSRHMSRVKIIVTVAFVMALSAGASVGMLMARSTDSRAPRSWMADELGLSSDQRDQLRSIWQDVSRNRQRDWERRHAIEKERNEAIVALLSPEQKAEYDAVLQQSQLELQEISKQRDETQQQAVERTKQILSPSQRSKYEELLQKKRDGKENRRGSPSTDPSTRVSSLR